MKGKITVFLIASVLILAAQAVAANLEYVRSYQWNNIRDAIPQGNYLYCGLDEGLLVLDISAPSHPKVVSQAVLENTKGEYQFFDAQVLYGNYIYMARYGGGLALFDISDPISPKGETIIDGKVNNVKVSGRYAFIAKDDSIFEVLDISKPEKPQPLGSLNVNGSIDYITISASTAFLAVNEEGLGGPTSGELMICDIHDPLSPKFIGDYHPARPVMAAAVRENYAYLLIERRGLQVVDISDLANPQLVGEGDCQAGGGYSQIVLDGNFAFLSPDNLKYSVFDISDPKNPVLVNDKPIGFNWSRFTIKDTLAFVRSESPEGRYDGPEIPPLTILNISNPGDIQVIGTYGEFCDFQDISVVGNYGYVVDWDKGLKILDLSKKPGEEALGQLDIKAELQSIFVNNGYVYLMPLEGPIIVADVRDPYNPKQIARIDAKYSSECIYPYKHYILMAIGISGIDLIDVAEPSKPKLVSKIPTTAEVAQIAIRDNSMFLISGGLQIFDIKDIKKPIFKGSYDPGHAKWLDISGEYAFVADGDSGLLIFNISNAENIHPIGSYKAPEVPNAHFQHQFERVEVRDQYAFLLRSLAMRAVYMVDVSDKSKPILVDTFGDFHTAERMAVTNDKIYIPDMQNILELKINK